MKQKIVVSVPMSCSKCKTEVLTIAAKYGPSSMSIEESGKLVVSGEGIDSANLTASLRNKFRCATILSVEELKEKVEKQKPKPNPNGDSTESSTQLMKLPCNQFCQPASCGCQLVVYDQESPSPNMCFIL